MHHSEKEVDVEKDNSAGTCWVWTSCFAQCVSVFSRLFVDFP